MADSIVAAVLPPAPPSLAERGFGLRPEVPEDRDFLATLYISTRWEELAQTGWPDEQKLAFLGQQFQCQFAYYGQVYADAARGIITLGDRPVGRLYLHAFPDELRVVDVSLIPDYRAQGIGTALLRAAYAQGRDRGVPVTIHVEVFNVNARRLYERLGFVEVKDGPQEVYRKMVWWPA